MSTVVLNLYTSAFPTITNRIKASVALETDPGVIVTSQIDSTAGHPAKAWSFPGLNRANYSFSLDEIDVNGNVVRNLAFFDVVPSSTDGALERGDEQIQVGVTTGLVAGATSFVFDGTGGKPDYRNYDITFSEIDGRGIMKKGVDYSWDKVSGTFQLLLAGDQFQNGVYYNIHFNPILLSSSGSVSSNSSFDRLITLKTATGNILNTDFGGELLLEFVKYGEMTLPDITTVAIGRPLYISTGNTGTDFCAKILPLGTDVIKFKYGVIYMMPNESLRITRFKRPDNSNEWRVDQLNGNFKNCGTLITADALSSDLMNVVQMGAELDMFIYARLYNDVVLHLPLNQKIAYADWNTGNNKMFFSLAGPGNTFFVYDRTNIFELANKAGKAGDYVADQVGESNLTIGFPTGDSFTGHPYAPTALGKGLAANGPYTLNLQVTLNAGKETYPKHCFYNKYILS